jgi:dinuclear metal center YbgI/SA1388 family protein
MILKEIIAFLEQQAPPALQENYDNSGLLVGDPNMEITGAIVCLDSTEAVIEEAKRKKCNLVIAHHPIVFSGLKKLTGKNYIERTVIMAIRENIAIYAIHTNLDNVMHGVNKKIADTLGLVDTHILEPKEGSLMKLSVFVPTKAAEVLKNALFEAGAGNIGNYDECSFSTQGEGTYRAGEGAKPALGEIGKRHHEPEVKVEVLLPEYLQHQIVNAMKKNHPYEEVAYDLVSLKNEWGTVGSGMIGSLPQAQSATEFLQG